MRHTFLVIFLLISFNCIAQNRVVTDFIENHSAALSLYFYPSTLRMINLERNVEFDEMIRGIKKARFFRLDSGQVTKDDLLKFRDELSGHGFEEIMMVKNKELDMQVWGIEKRTPQTVVISKNDNEVYLVEVDGMINIAKIPKLTETLNKNAFLDVMNLKGKKTK